jgi:hypothetical protein
MKQIQINPITKQVNSVRVAIDIAPDKGMAVATVYYEGMIDGSTIFIEGAEYDAWGTDDNYIYDLILSKLGLQKA